MSLASRPNIHNLPSEIVRKIAAHIPPFTLIKLKQAFGESWVPQDLSFAYINLRTIHKLWTDDQRIPTNRNFTSTLKAPQWYQLGSNYLAAFLLLTSVFKVPTLAECFETANRASTARRLEFYIVNEGNRSLLRNAFRKAASQPAWKARLLQTKFSGSKKVILGEILTCMRIICCIDMHDLVEDLLTSHFGLGQPVRPILGEAEEFLFEEAIMNACRNANLETIRVLHRLLPRLFEGYYSEKTLPSLESLHIMAAKSLSAECVKLTSELFPVDITFHFLDDLLRDSLPWDIVRSFAERNGFLGKGLFLSAVRHGHQEAVEALKEWTKEIEYERFLEAVVPKILSDVTALDLDNPHVNLEQLYFCKLYREVRTQLPYQQDYEGYQKYGKIIITAWTNLRCNFDELPSFVKQCQALATFFVKDMPPLERFALAYALVRSGFTVQPDKIMSLILPPEMSLTDPQISDAAEDLYRHCLANYSLDAIPWFFVCHPIFSAEGRHERFLFAMAYSHQNYEQMVSVRTRLPTTFVDVRPALSKDTESFVAECFHSSSSNGITRLRFPEIFDHCTLLDRYLRQLPTSATLSEILLLVAIAHSYADNGRKGFSLQQVVQIFEKHWERLAKVGGLGTLKKQLDYDLPISGLTWNPRDYYSTFIAVQELSPHRLMETLISPTADASVMDMFFVKFVVMVLGKLGDNKERLPPNNLVDAAIANYTPSLARPRVDAGEILASVEMSNYMTPEVIELCESHRRRSRELGITNCEASVKAYWLFRGSSDEVFGPGVSVEVLAEAKKFIETEANLVEKTNILRNFNIVSIANGIIDPGPKQEYLRACVNGQIDSIGGISKSDLTPEDIQDGLFVACYLGHEDLAEFLLSEFHFNTVYAHESLPLRIACRRGHVEVVRILLAHRCAIPTHPRGPFFSACALEDEDKALRILEMLVGEGSWYDR
ncbi:hypothetical protein HDU97_009795 [Phlyctochytrium planicorne]|nr:hypothetical protein HDU97_009795 [Phlyctochytrium planicorne]